MSADGVVGRIHNDGDFTQLRTQLVTPPRPGTARAEAERIGSTDTVDQISACGTNRLQPELLVLRSEEHTSELQSHLNLVCRLLLEKKKNKSYNLQSVVSE